MNTNTKDDKNLSEAYESVFKLHVEALDSSPNPTLKGMTYAKSGGPVDAAKQKNSNEDLTEWIKERISRELPQDLDVREDLVKLYKKLSANQLGKEITKTTAGDENASRAKFAMSGYDGESPMGTRRTFS
jgi:hypothetical protein